MRTVNLHTVNLKCGDLPVSFRSVKHINLLHRYSHAAQKSQAELFSQGGQSLSLQSQKNKHCTLHRIGKGNNIFQNQKATCLSALNVSLGSYFY